LITNLTKSSDDYLHKTVPIRMTLDEQKYLIIHWIVLFVFVFGTDRDWPSSYNTRFILGGNVESYKYL